MSSEQTKEKKKLFLRGREIACYMNDTKSTVIKWSFFQGITLLL